MNAAFVNGANGFFPSYDLGAALEWAHDDWSANAVVMRVHENDDGNSFVFAGVQLARRVNTELGEGNYRLILSHASDDFASPDGTSNESRWAVNLSMDQELNDILGVWARLGLHDDAAATPYESLLSGGLDINGTLWGRAQDNVGLGYAYLKGGNTGLDSSQVFESYARFGLTDALALTVDAQYIRDDADVSTNLHGWILGLRVVFEF